MEEIPSRRLRSPGERHYVLEFVPDDIPGLLAAEARSLKDWLESVRSSQKKISTINSAAEGV